MELCLIRHGETTFNAEDRMQGKRDIPLTPRGLEEAGILGGKLKSEKILPRILYSSPVARAYNTAMTLHLGVPIMPNSAFSARSLGTLEGRTKRELEILLPGITRNLLRWDFCPPGGTETLQDLFDRANKEIERLVEVEKDEKYILVVTHSGVLEALVRGWFSLGCDDTLPFDLKNTGAFLFSRVSRLWDYRRTIAVSNRSGEDYS